jgi:parvulin-like peptidyl-prolyl isomerase
LLTRLSVVLGLFVISMGIVVGCGSSASTSAVTVNGTAISESRVDAWLSAFLGGGAARSSGGDDAIVDACIAARRQAKKDDGRRGCEAALKSAKAETVGFLVRSIWLEREARRRSLVLTKNEIRREIARRKDVFSSSRAFKRYLAGAGMSGSQFAERVRRDALFHRLMLAVVPSDLTVSRADVRHFYRRHASEFDRPTTRDLGIVVTESRRAAIRARAAVEAGRPWRVVVDEFTIDASKRTGGRISIDSNNVIHRLRAAVFSAPIGQLVGPVNIKGVWWIFRVDRHRQARRLSLAEAAPRIRASIRSTRDQSAADRLIAYLTRRYRRYTVCHNGYIAPECWNGSRPVSPGAVNTSGS